MNMHPDKQIANDALAISTILIALLCTFIYVAGTAGYTPIDDCANHVRRALSPYQVKQLIGSHDLPPSYGEVRTWCSADLAGYEIKLNDAKTYPEFPSTPDMY